MKKRFIWFLSAAIVFICGLALVACQKEVRDEREQLPVPALFRMVNGILFWEEVDGANGYTLEINGESMTVEETRFAPEGYEYNVEYLFRVKANGGEDYRDSEWAELTHVFEETATPGLAYTLLTSSRAYSVSGTEKLSGRVVIPSQYEGVPVREIAVRGFRENTDITEIVIPNSVTAIGSSAFSGCSKLEKIAVPDSIRVIESNAFEGTAWLESQADGPVYAGKFLYTYKGTMPENTVLTELREDTVGVANYALDTQNLVGIELPASLCYIGEHAFGGAGLATVTLPAGLKSIGAGAFRGSAITEIKIPEGVTAIEEETFEYCYELVRVELPAGLKSIGVSAFEHCDALTSVAIPEGVETIENYAFQYCENLTHVELPAELKSMGVRSFYDSALTEIVFAGTRAEWQMVTKGDYWDCFYQNGRDEFGFRVYGHYRFAYTVTCSNAVIEVPGDWVHKSSDNYLW